MTEERVHSRMACQLTVLVMMLEKKVLSIKFASKGVFFF